jgi:hypothetical protein
LRKPTKSNPPVLRDDTGVDEDEGEDKEDEEDDEDKDDEVDDEDDDSNAEDGAATAAADEDKGRWRWGKIVVLGCEGRGLN